MSLFKPLRDRLSEARQHDHQHSKSSKFSNSSPPPEWTPAPETSHTDGLYADAPQAEYEAAERFCAQYPPYPPRLMPSDLVDRVRTLGCRAWGLKVPPVDYYEPRFFGSILNPVDTRIRSSEKGRGAVQVQTTKACKDVSLLSDLPITAGLYDTKGKDGVYFEVAIHKMNGLIAIGTACRPYPSWRLPGWNRLSAGLHLDDFRKFFEDPDGGRDYYHHRPSTSDKGPPVFVPGDTIGCGYVFSSGTLFFTYNGQRLPPAFTGVYLPRRNYDVFAAVGVEGECEFEVNFGGEGFRWAEGNEWAWRVEGHVGVLDAVGPSGEDGDELPSYREVGRANH